MTRVLSGLSVVTLGRLGAATIGILTQIYLARVLSASALGMFFLATSLAAFLAITATCGLPLVAARFLVRYQRNGRSALAALFVATTRRIVLTASLVLTALAIALIAVWPGLPADQRAALLIGSLAAPGFAIAQLSGAMLIALRRYQLSYLPDLIARPVLFLGAIVAMNLVTGGVDLSVTLAIFAAFVAVQAAYQYGAVRRIAGPVAQTARGIGRIGTVWLRAAAPLTGVILVTAIFADVAILAAGLFLHTADLAVFGVTVKIALVVGFVQTTTHKLLQPDLAEALLSGDRARFSRTVSHAHLIAIGVGIAALLGALIAGDLVLSIWGSDFVAGHGILLALLVGQILVAAGGPAIQILTLARGQATAAWSSVIAVLCLVATNALFVPPLGLGGAALGLVCTEVVWASILAIQVRRAGIICDIFATLSPRHVIVPLAARP